MNSFAPSNGQVSIFDDLPGAMRESRTAISETIRKARSFSSSVSRQNTPSETADEALEHVGDHADKEWMKAALDKVWGLCMAHEEFTTDLVWDRLSIPAVGTPEPRAMGAIMRIAARRRAQVAVQSGATGRTSSIGSNLGHAA